MPSDVGHVVQRIADFLWPLTEAIIDEELHEQN